MDLVTKDGKNYSALAVNRAGDPGPQSAVEPPRPCRVRTDTYGNGRSEFTAAIVATSREYVCIEQLEPGWGTWHAWIPRAHVRPLSELERK